MAFLKGSFLLALFIIHTNEAIHLDFFSFKRAPSKNETSKTIFIQPTNEIREMISIQPTRTIKIGESSVMLPKHEFENETEAVDASPEQTTESKLSKPGLNGQEIDETRHSVNKTFDEKNFEKTLVKSIPSLAKMKPPKVSSLPPRTTIPFTKIVLSLFTKYETVYPSCIKIENEKSTCEGDLITIQPTPTVSNNQRTPVVDPVDDSMFDVIEPPENRRERTSDGMISMEDLEEARKSVRRTVFIEPSELDFDFEEFNATRLMPIIEAALNNEPKYEITTQYLTTTLVQTVTNTQATATVIAHNCIPRSYNLKKCPMTEHERTSLVRKKPSQMNSQTDDRKIVSLKSSTKRPPIQRESKPHDSLDQLNKYLIMNANRLINDPPGGFETIDLNMESTIVESSDQKS